MMVRWVSRRRSGKTKPSRETYDLAHDQKWASLQSRAAAFPQEAAFTNEYGETPLHVALWREPSVEAVRALLGAMPQVFAMRDHCGRTPLHTACWNLVPSEVTRRILEVGPDATEMQDKFGSTPIETIWHAFTKSREEGRQTLEAATSPAELTDPANSELSNFWTNVVLLMSAAYFGSVANVMEEKGGARKDEKFFLLHAACAQRRCPRELLEFILRLYPEGATVRDRKGRFPLVAAIEQGIMWDDGLGAFLKAAPEVLYTRDAETNLFPSMFAATSSESTVDSIYRLLRAAPEVVKQ